MKEKIEKARGYMTGIIALVFMIIGYQTALFVHHAAVMKITANRDAPDTVYIYINIQNRQKEYLLSPPRITQ